MSTPVRSGTPAARAHPELAPSGLGSASAKAPDAGAPAPSRPRLAGGGARAVSGGRGVVAAAERNATQAGIEVLEAGGNAADAAVAVAAVLAVTHPNAGNLGGGGFALVRRPGGATLAIDFRESAPRSLTRSAFDAMIASGARGPVAVGVPGSVAGLVRLQREQGRLSLGRVFERAVSLARGGHSFGRHQAELLARVWPALSLDPAARAIFGQAGRPKRAGELLVQSDLAATLERVARSGEAGFYSGETARALEVATRGRLDAKDLGDYRAEARDVLAVAYRGFEVHTMPPPSAGGLTLAGTLLALERIGAHTLPAGSAAEAHAVLEVSRRAQAFRRLAVVAPPAKVDGAVRERMLRFLDPSRLLAVPVNSNRATPSAEIHPLYAEALRETEHTTHLSVVDADGMAVALTTTLSASFGARMVAPGTGLVLNNAVASFSSVGDNQPVAGRRTTSSMAPTLVLAGGRTVLVLGTPGGDTIPSTIVGILRNLVDRGMPLDAAIEAPRLHHGFVPDEVRYEGRRPPNAELLRGLRALGHRVRASRPVQGDANCILIDAERAYGYADPREPGGVALALP